MDIQIIAIRENSEFIERGIDYFAEKWSVDRKIYADSITTSIETKSPLPRWYLMLKDNEIIGSYGLITNDFISRMDLFPWICALYVEKSERGKKLGEKLLEHGRKEAAKLGYDKIYLATDHENYYERYGWQYIANAFHPWGEESRIYEHTTLKDKENLKFLGTPPLETERLILRKFEITDAEDVFEYAKNPELTEYVTFETHKTIDDAYSFINWTIERVKKDQGADWAIVLKGTKKVIGSIGFGNVSFQNSSGEIGYALSQEYWGQGIITEAVKRVIQFAFEEMKINRVEEVHFIGNEASGRVMEKAGMKYEGIIRNKMFAKQKYWDVKQYAILKSDLVD